MSPVLLCSLIASAGLAAWWMAGSLRLPLVPLLLAAGALLRLAGLDYVIMANHDALIALCGLGLVVVFFEGGRALSSTRLDDIRHQVQHLAAIGPKVGWLLSAFAAQFVLGLDLQHAMLLGALLMITAPYAVDGLTERLGATDATRRTLQWETYSVSCFGTAWAVLVYICIQANVEHPNLVTTLVYTCKVAAVGAACGWGAAQLLLVLRPRMPEALQNPASFTLALLTFAAAQAVVSGAGLAAAGLAGYLTARHGEEGATPDGFGRDLRTLILASLGVVMGVALPLPEMAEQWPSRLAYGLVLVFLARPLLVAIACRKGHLPLREKVMLAAVAPRGTMTLAATTLVTLKIGQSQLTPIVVWVVLCTNLLPWVLAPLLSRAFPEAPVAEPAAVSA